MFSIYSVQLWTEVLGSVYTKQVFSTCHVKCLLCSHFYFVPKKYKINSFSQIFVPLHVFRIPQRVISNFFLFHNSWLTVLVIEFYYGSYKQIKFNKTDMQSIKKKNKSLLHNYKFKISHIFHGVLAQSTMEQVISNAK